MVIVVHHIGEIVLQIVEPNVNNKICFLNEEAKLQKIFLKKNICRKKIKITNKIQDKINTKNYQ